MPQIRADMHCDWLTARGQPKFAFNEGAFQVFAAFVRKRAAEYAAAKNLFCQSFLPYAVKSYGDFFNGQNKWCALSVENIGFTGGRTGDIRRLKSDGVIMASLVWNTPNCLAYPNLAAGGGREARGLKPAGRRAVCLLDECKIIVDISHLSDGGAEEILRGRKIPLVASHSCANAVHAHPRNLTDFQLRAIAACGGVVGVNYYAKFLGGRGFGAVYRHIRHIIDVAGEDAVAFGSDWLGVPYGQSAVEPEEMDGLLNYLNMRGVPARAVEKLACENFLRVFKEVCG